MSTPINEGSYFSKPRMQPVAPSWKLRDFLDIKRESTYLPLQRVRRPAYNWRGGYLIWEEWATREGGTRSRRKGEVDLLCIASSVIYKRRGARVWVSLSGLSGSDCNVIPVSSDDPFVTAARVSPFYFQNSKIFYSDTKSANYSIDR